MNYHNIPQPARLKTREVKVGNLLIGSNHPVRVQTMTTTDTMDTLATVEQSIRCIEAGAELVRITAPSKKEAENLQNIKDELNKRGYNTPLVADIHFTPNAAAVSYTHLDVYKRQLQAFTIWHSIFGWLARRESIFLKEIIPVGKMKCV